MNPLRQEIVFGRVVVNENNTTFIEVGNKTEDHRTVPVPATVMDALVAHIDRYCPAGDREAFLFLTSKGTHPKRSNFSRDVLRPALKRAGLADRSITWLSLRHTAASLMFDAGLTIFDVQRRLGHHSPVLTQEIYTHLMRERYDEGRRTMEDLHPARHGNSSSAKTSHNSYHRPPADTRIRWLAEWIYVPVSPRWCPFVSRSRRRRASLR